MYPVATDRLAQHLERGVPRFRRLARRPQREGRGRLQQSAGGGRRLGVGALR